MYETSLSSPVKQHENMFKNVLFHYVVLDIHYQRMQSQEHNPVRQNQAVRQANLYRD